MIATLQCLKLEGLVCGFLAPLLGSLLCKARLHIHPVPPAAKTRLQRSPSLQQSCKGTGGIFWTFRRKIIGFSEMMPELRALVMTLSPVVLEQWVCAGTGTERPLWMKLVNIVLHRWLHPSPHPPGFLEAGMMPFLLVGKGRYVISFKALCQLQRCLRPVFFLS